MEKKSKNLHPRNKFNQEYDFPKLMKKVPRLKEHVLLSPEKKMTIDFSDPEAVFLLNKALLESGYAINEWEILENSLCPSIPGRLNYIHFLADLLGDKAKKKLHVLDIGTGSNLIFPILGAREYRWKMVGSETHKPSLYHARNVLKKNPELSGFIDLREQENPEYLLKGIIRPNEYFDAILCNPPFYKSRDDYRNTIIKKNQKLHKVEENMHSNFKGLSNELWYPGGEKKFISQLIYESIELRDQIGLCSSLVANKENLKPLRAILEYHKIQNIQVTQMHQGNKISRILSWELSPIRK